jgi:hypothetical protein
VQKALQWRKTLVQQNVNEECLEPCGGQGKSFRFMECTYCDFCLEDDFISLVIKIFGCLHRQNDDFLHVLTWHDQ